MANSSFTKGANDPSAPITPTNNSASIPTVSITQNNASGVHFNFSGAAVSEQGGSFFSAYYIAPATVNGSSLGAGYGVPIGFSECFPPGTLVKTPDGDRPIEDIEVGDTVYSFDHVSNVPIENTVTSLQNIPDRKGLVIINETFKCSKYHKLWVGTPDTQPHWKNACEIVVGEYLTGFDGEKIWVLEVDQDNETVQNFHNLKLQGPYHSYYAGNVVVHNKCPFLYTKQNGRWKLENSFIYELDSPEKEAVQRRPLKSITNKFWIREIEPETSYIKNLALIAKDEAGQETRLEWLDAKELVIKQKQIIEIEFEEIPEGTVSLEIEAEGYYETIDEP